MLDDGELIKYENHYQDYHEVDSLYTNPLKQRGVLHYECMNWCDGAGFFRKR